ncbi:hypothetical protein BSL78_29324 [Apostichopus japonicus]|uniref:Uncharacterized protein n=1 Tax=Stichopus japonicus TaxID=307972 RepID=A0A2G8JDP2_STIJA|nr:hypothetical protein BSL78_29324 [Apostichopus japonicus]
MSRNQLKCVSCSMFRPGRAWDEHDLCPKCRSCTRRDPCLVCIKFSPTQWQEIDQWLKSLRTKLQGKLDLIPNDIGAEDIGGTGEREEEGEVEREVEESGQERAEGERERERERERESTPNGPGDVRRSYDQREGQEQREGSCQEKTSQEEARSAGLEVTPQCGPQQDRPTERGPPATESSGPKESAIEGSVRRSRSHSREPEREPERRVPTETPTRESRGRETSRRPRRDRSGTHSRSPRRKERRRHSPTSDESSESSDDGYRRAKRRRRSPRRRQEEEPAWLAQLTGLLRPLIEQRVTTVTDKAPGSTGSGPTTAPHPVSDPDALDCRASVNLSGLEDEGDLMDPTEPLDYDPMEDSFSRSYEPEEAPITGGALPQELMARAADIFRRHLGFEEPETQPQKAGRVSKLTATGEMSSKPKTTMPVDATCYDRFEAIADKNRWTAFPARADRAVRVPDEAWRALFKCPTIPQEAKERLKAEHGASSSQTFKTPDQRKLEELLVEVDTAARSGMKFASVLMLSAEVLMRHHQQLPEDDSQVSRDEAGQLLLLLGPLVRLAYDQFARVATRSVKARRENVVSAIRWPSTEARNRMLALPVLGEDLFGGNFQKKLQEEVARRETLAKSEFRPSATQRPRPFRPRENKPTRGARAAPARPLSRGALRGRSRGTAYRPTRSWTPRGGRGTAPPRRDNDRSSTRPSFASQP